MPPVHRTVIILCAQTMNDADLYIDRIRLEQYFTDKQCRKCGASSCKQLIERLKQGGMAPSDLFFLSAGRSAALEAALRADRVMGQVPMLQLPRPGPPGLVELNHPKPEDPVLVTANSQFTQQVVLAVMSTGLTPAFALFVDTRGDTLDMAVILDTFTTAAVKAAVERELGPRDPAAGPLVLPGLAAALKDDIGAATGRTVEVGPVCAAEIPLWFRDRWVPA